MAENLFAINENLYWSTSNLFRVRVLAPGIIAIHGLLQATGEIDRTLYRVLREAQYSTVQVSTVQYCQRPF